MKNGLDGCLDTADELSPGTLLQYHAMEAKTF
jgi:hypothetical protein